MFLQKVNSFTKCAIGRKLIIFFMKNKAPTLDKIQKAINDGTDFQIFHACHFLIYYNDTLTINEIKQKCAVDRLYYFMVKKI